MTFEAVWGFDPEQVLKARSLFQRVFARQSGEGLGEMDEGGAPDAGIPHSADAQIDELNRMFRL